MQNIDPDTIKEGPDVILPTATERLPHKRRTALLSKLGDFEREISSHIIELVEHRALRHERHTTELMSEQALHDDGHKAEPSQSIAGAVSIAPAHPSAEISAPYSSPGIKTAKSATKSKRLWPGKRRVPVLHQMSMVECGAASLAMVLNYYGYWWRSRFSCLASDDFLLEPSTVFDFATSIIMVGEPVSQKYVNIVALVEMDYLRALLLRLLVLMVCASAR